LRVFAGNEEPMEKDKNRLTLPSFCLYRLTHDIFSAILEYNSICQKTMMGKSKHGQRGIQRTGPWVEKPVPGAAVNGSRSCRPKDTLRRLGQALLLQSKALGADGTRRRQCRKRLPTVLAVRRTGGGSDKLACQGQVRVVQRSNSVPMGTEFFAFRPPGARPDLPFPPPGAPAADNGRSDKPVNAGWHSGSIPVPSGTGICFSPPVTSEGGVVVKRRATGQKPRLAGPSRRQPLLTKAAITGPLGTPCLRSDRKGIGRCCEKIK